VTDAGRTASSDRDRRAWANLCFFGRGLVQDRVRLLEVDPIRSDSRARALPVLAFTDAAAASGNSFSSATVIASAPWFKFSRFVRSSVNSIQEPFRLLLDVHLIVTLNDLVFVPSS
jgi:hypothetical protein